MEILSDKQNPDGFALQADGRPLAGRLSIRARGENITLVKAAFFGDPGPAGETPGQVYGEEGIARIDGITRLFPDVVSSENLEASLPQLRDLEVIFATWGMLRLTASQLDRLPKLKAVFYAAGTVRYFAQPFLERGIIVTSSAAANAVPVAEFTVAQMLLANKGYFRNVREYRATRDYLGSYCGDGNFNTTVSLLGAGQIGRKVIDLLRSYRLRILVFDPFFSEAEAAALGVEKASLEEAFANGLVVSNHLADLPETAGMLNRPLFEAMRPGATFINTGRGRTVNDEDLAFVLKHRPDLTALLDVTHPEPLPAESPLWLLPNVHISSHIAGSKGAEIRRLAQDAIDEFERWNREEPLHYAVTEGAFERVA